MTRSIPLAVGLGLIAAIAGVAEGITIAKNGEAKAVVVVGPNARAPERHAADQLVVFLRKITGADVKLIHKPDPDRPNVFVGPIAAKMVDPTFSTDGLGQEGIVMRTVGKDLILAGGDPRGSLYCVYTFLEEQAGCRWWSPSRSTIPKHPTLSVDKLDVRYVPPLELRTSDSAGSIDPAWAVRNKFNGQYQQLGGLRGGKQKYIATNKWSSHTFWTLIPPELYFKTHPEWFSLIDGKRTHKSPKYFASSLCLTNEEMRCEMVKNQKLALLWNPHAEIISISQVDDGGEPNRCQCDKCVAIEKQDNPSGLMIRFVNSVAADIQEDFPDIIIDTLAYHYTQKPPKHTKPRPGLVVRLCSIKCSFSVPMSHDRNKMFRDDLVAWSKICNRLYVWDYVANFSYTMLPHPNLRVLGPNVKFLVAHNVKGIFAEGITTPNTEMAELRNWVMGKLLWNPDLDGWKLVEEFANGYYGPAGKHIFAYLTVIHDAVDASGDYVGLSSPPTAKFLSFETLTKARAHLLAAAAAVRDDPTLLRLAQREQLPVTYAFLLKWDELRKQAKAAGAEWPMPGTLHEACQQFRKKPPPSATT